MIRRDRKTRVGKAKEWAQIRRNMPSFHDFISKPLHTESVKGFPQLGEHTRQSSCKTAANLKNLCTGELPGAQGSSATIPTLAEGKVVDFHPRKV